MNKILLFLLIFIVFYVLWDLFSPQKESTISRQDYITAIELINSKLPIQLDSETELRNITLQGNSIEYIYALRTKQKLEVKIPELEQSFKKEMIKTYCANSDMMITFRNSGYTAKYIYLDSTSQELFSTEITPQECAS